MASGSPPAEIRAVSTTLLVRNVRLRATPDNPSAIRKSYNVTCVDGTVVSVEESHIFTSVNKHSKSDDVGQVEGVDEVLDANGLGLLLPGYVASIICHSRD